MEQVVVLFLGFLFCGLDVGMLCVFFQSMFGKKTQQRFLWLCLRYYNRDHIWSEFLSEFHVKFCNFTIGYVDFYSDYVEADLSERHSSIWLFFILCLYAKGKWHLRWSIVYWHLCFRLFHRFCNHQGNGDSVYGICGVFFAAAFLPELYGQNG